MLLIFMAPMFSQFRNADFGFLGAERPIQGDVMKIPHGCVSCEFELDKYNILCLKYEQRFIGYI